MLTRCNRAGAVACRSIRAEAIRCAVRDYVSERKKSASPSNPQSEAAKIAFKRTQSILLDEGNSIIHPEHYKLHKEFQDAQSEDDTTLSPNAMRWQSDPYLSMLASPIRRCIWSTRPMPKDLLISIKAASYEEELPADSSGSGPRRTRWRSSIFAREILHRSSLSPSDRAGRKQARGYVICKRNAVHHFMSKGGPWKRLDPNAEPNPLLVFQMESQLRRRVVQELEILADVQTMDSQAFGLHPLSEDALLGSRESKHLLMASSHGSSPAPAAIIELSTAADHALVPAGASSCLVPLVVAGTESSYTDLARHRVPVYSQSGIFAMAAGAGQEGSRLPAQKGASAPRTWADLATTHPHIYDRELNEATAQKEEFVRLAKKLLPASVGETASTPQLIYVPTLARQAVPLLTALWRWRMWVGEGWSGDGFGMAAAMGREFVPTSRPDLNLARDAGAR